MFWILLTAALWLFGCSFDANNLRSVDPPVSIDAGTPDAQPILGISDTVRGPDAQIAPDTRPTAVDTVPDTVPATPDTTPVCPVVTVQRPADGAPQDTRWSATVQATSVDGFCFKTCDSPVFALSWKGFSGRTLSVNGSPVTLIDQLSGKVGSDAGSTEAVGSFGAVGSSGLRTFQISAGSSASASFTWSGGSVACP